MIEKTKLIHCCGCDTEINARLTDGGEIYPHRKDLHKLPFWKCEKCSNYVGCHHKTSNPTAPLGVIPTPEIRKLRREIHTIIDPLWKYLGHSRKSVYSAMSKRMGREFHTSHLASVNEANEAMACAKELSEVLEPD